MRSFDDRMSDYGLLREEYDRIKAAGFAGRVLDRASALQSFFGDTPQDYWLHHARTVNIAHPRQEVWMLRHPDCEFAVAILLFWRTLEHYPYTDPEQASWLAQSDAYDLDDPESLQDMIAEGHFNPQIDDGYIHHMMLRTILERVRSDDFPSTLRLIPSEVNFWRARFDKRIAEARDNGWRLANAPFRVPEVLSSAPVGRDAATVFIPPRDKITAAFLLYDSDHDQSLIDESLSIQATFERHPNKSVEAFLDEWQAASKSPRLPSPEPSGFVRGLILGFYILLFVIVLYLLQQWLFG